MFVVSLLATAQDFGFAPSLRQLTRDSGYIFAGRVSAIERVPAASNPEGAAVRITFQVEQGIRGVRTGQTLVRMGRLVGARRTLSSGRTGVAVPLSAQQIGIDQSGCWRLRSFHH